MLILRPPSAAQVRMCTDTWGERRTRSSLSSSCLCVCVCVCVCVCGFVPSIAEGRCAKTTSSITRATTSLVSVLPPPPPSPPPPSLTLPFPYSNKALPQRICIYTGMIPPPPPRKGNPRTDSSSTSGSAESKNCNIAVERRICAGRMEIQTPDGKVSLASVVCVCVLVWWCPPWRVRREALMSSMCKRGKTRGEGGVCDGNDEEEEEGKIVPTKKRAKVSPLLLVWA